MGSLLIILALIFSLLVAVIAAANNQPVSVNYIFGEAHISLIVLIFGAAAAGAMVIGLLSLYRGIRVALQMRGEKKRQEELQRRLDSLEQEKFYIQQKLKELQKQQGAAKEGEGEVSPR